MLIRRADSSGFVLNTAGANRLFSERGFVGLRISRGTRALPLRWSHDSGASIRINGITVGDLQLNKDGRTYSGTAALLEITRHHHPLQHDLDLVGNGIFALCPAYGFFHSLARNPSVKISRASSRQVQASGSEPLAVLQPGRVMRISSKLKGTTAPNLVIEKIKMRSKNDGGVSALVYGTHGASKFLLNFNYTGRYWRPAARLPLKFRPVHDWVYRNIEELPYLWIVAEKPVAGGKVD